MAFGIEYDSPFQIRIKPGGVNAVAVAVENDQGLAMLNLDTATATAFIIHPVYYDPRAFHDMASS